MAQSGSNRCPSGFLGHPKSLPGVDRVSPPPPKTRASGMRISSPTTATTAIMTTIPSGRRSPCRQLPAQRQYCAVQCLTPARPSSPGPDRPEATRCRRRRGERGYSPGCRVFRTSCDVLNIRHQEQHDQECEAETGDSVEQAGTCSNACTAFSPQAQRPGEAT